MEEVLWLEGFLFFLSTFFPFLVPSLISKNQMGHKSGKLQNCNEEVTLLIISFPSVEYICIT